MNRITFWLSRQPWIDSPLADLGFIISPAFLITALVLLFPDFFTQANHFPVWIWAILIVGVDVAHVYSTLFRTYWRPTSKKINQRLLIGIPLACWAIGILLYGLDDTGLLFWRTLTYLAVFHFIRQQYGFMAIYSRKADPAFRAWRWLDHSVIYLSMIYPLIYWHTHLPRHFNWFLDGDFLTGLPLAWNWWSGVCYALMMALYCLKEGALSIRHRQFNLPKNLLLAGTALSWYVGIVQFNGDLAFTATNVISHGIPYMALIWLHNRRHSRQTQSHADNPKPMSSGINLFNRLFQWPGLPLFIFSLWLLAWLEEGLWDGLIWREHLSLFAPFAWLPFNLSTVVLMWLVPLLALPQATHYILDGFIWRLNSQTEQSETFFS